MPRCFPAITVPALCMYAIAQPATADIAPADVWADWKSYMESAGYSITATEEASADQLTLRDVVLQVELPEEDGTFAIEMESIIFSDRGADVDVTLPDQIRMIMNGTSEEGQTGNAVIVIDQTDPQLRASGDPSDLVYDYAARMVRIALDEIIADGQALGPEFIRAEMKIADVSARTEMQTGDQRRMVQTMQTGAAEYALFVKDPAPDVNDSLDLKGRVASLAANGSSLMPKDIAAADLNAFLGSDADANGSFTFGPGGYTALFDNADGGGTINTESQGGTIEVGLNEAGIAYRVRQNGLALNVLMNAFPLPISVAAAQSGLDLLFPVRKGDEPENFKLAFALRDFTMSDAIWGMFDPTGQLPRDPATLALSLSGTARVLVDILDTEQVEALSESGAVPVELDTANIDDLSLSLAGAALTGKGAFVFDNSDTTTFNGMPKPVGSIEMRLSGGNTLLDKLVAMGLLPEDQAMGARMMLGLFAVPGEGEDVLNSTIEINEAGHIIANGQRIQ